MNCQFCYTGRMGLLGNLSAAQIVEQVRAEKAWDCMGFLLGNLSAAQIVEQVRAGEAWFCLLFLRGNLSAAQIVEQMRAMFCCPHHVAGEGSLPPPSRATLPVPIDPVPLLLSPL